MSNLKDLVGEWVQAKAAAEKVLELESAIATEVGSGGEIVMPGGKRFKVRKRHGEETLGLSPVKELKFVRSTSRLERKADNQDLSHRKVAQAVLLFGTLRKGFPFLLFQ